MRQLSLGEHKDVPKRKTDQGYYESKQGGGGCFLRRGCLTTLLGAALAIGLLALLAYGLLQIPSPTNILVLGIDKRPGEGNTVRTDTILVLRSDPSTPHLTLLSIPRDLWVTIPNRGEERINTAHFYGEMEEPGSGLDRAAETVSLNFDIPIHRSLRLDFDAFREVIDAAGGIDVDVPVPIVDNEYPTEDYGTMRIEIPAGTQHMNGETALQYARSRHGSSDFDRAARQQQIVLALAKKLASPMGLIFLPRVYNAYQNAVETDLNLRDLFRLAATWQLARNEGLETIVIDRTLVTPYRTQSGASVLLPRWELIQPLVQAKFTH